MKSWLITLVLSLGIGWAAYTKGYDDGLKAGPQFIEELKRDRASRETDHKEFMEYVNSNEYEVPTREECVPVMNGEEIDVEDFCTSYLSEQNQAYQEAIQDGRSQYD